MPPPPVPLTRDLVLLGGGHTHALVLKRWAMDPLPGARVTLISPDPTAPYTGMLPGHVAGHYGREELEIDLVQLARRAGARLILDRACGIDRSAQTVALQGRPPVAYDVLSVDIGISSDLPALPGYAEHAVSAKPLGRYAARWERFVQAVATGAAPPQVAVIGGGVAGVELALAMAHRLRGTRGAQVTVIEAAPAPLPGIGAGARARLLAHMAAAGVSLRTGTAVAGITAEAVRLEDGAHLPAALVVGAAGTRPQDWLRGTGLDLTQGFITVGPTLQSPTDPRIFAAGDCAHMRHAPRPKAGVYAVRQAPVLLHNLRAALAEAGRLRQYHPQRDYLKLVSLGGRRALADKWGLPLEGRWLWALKDGIDARFMAGFAPPPVQAPPQPRQSAAGQAGAQGNQPLCGGCGAKIAPAPLRQALAGLPAPDRADIQTGAGDDAAVLRMGDMRQVIATDHLRAFSVDPFIMARIAAVHALGDIWAMGAAPQALLLNVTLPRMSEALQARTLAEIMAAAQAVAGAEGAAIVGGHSAMGAEMSIGFTVTGLAGDRVLTKSGARPGDALILTRPLGTGIVLAAEMAMQAQGRDVAAALDAMATPQGAAAALLAPRASAMTDVTGFGLAGHLMEMLTAAGCGATLFAGALPVLPGVRDLIAAGHGSALAQGNRAALAGQVHPGAPEGATDVGALLHDPQTAGGLLAAVPEDAAPILLSALQSAGFTQAAVIGTLHDGAPDITVNPGAGPVRGA
ncbi:MAG: selenide, water dikinase SelD [Rhodobacteraceae bacterium]|nr:selenide, water dikinase SelD [Paracoccaceae bacterium]